MKIMVNNKPLFFSIILFMFIAVYLFGMPVIFGSMNHHGSMSNCPFMAEMSICPMILFDHISVWQSMFTFTTPQKTLAFALLLLLTVVFVAVAILKRNLLLLFSYYITRWRLHIRRDPELSLVNHLREEFSQGILNPKIY